MTLASVTLDDKYILQSGRVFLTGTQALVRLPIMQHLRDRAAGITSGCYISGYRGSPLGGLDQQLWAAGKHLAAHNIVFQPGVNEDLAATACWGTQQAHLDGDNKYDGVYAMWYGKGPGVDRTGDAFRHGNLAGSAALGGVVCLMGDDHTCESSTTAHQSEFAMVDAMMPILNPAGVQELLDYGLYGWALSRYSGCWVGLKCMKDTIDASASVNVDPARVRIAVPTDFKMPEGGLNIRWPDAPLEQEARLHTYKLEAAKAFALSNGLDQIIMDSPNARLGIATCGKSYMDVRQALQYLGIDEGEAARLGLRVYKIGMPWPLEPSKAAQFAQGLEKIIVVEEKRGLVEPQLKEVLYGKPDAPQIVGKHDEAGKILFRSNAALDPNEIAVAIGRRLLVRVSDASLPLASPNRNGCKRACWKNRQWIARRIFVLVARTARVRGCRKVRALWRESVVISWRSSWTAVPPAIPRWAEKVRAGLVKHRSSRRRTCSRTSVMEPTTTPDFLQCALLPLRA